MTSDKDSLRRLMRAVAFGLPLVPAIGCTLFSGPCGEPTPVVYERIIDASTVELDCVAVCESDAAVCERIDHARVSCQTADMQYHACGAGRRPSGPIEARTSLHTQDRRIAWLRDATLLEAASVPAFAHLGRALESHGAPRRLIAGAARAADDERRHTRAMASLTARRAGPFRITVRADEPASTSLFELARSNAVEGCVNEAWGAYEARAQAFAARDADVRDAMRVIAREEAEHALLSFAIDAWARSRLSASENARVDEASREAKRDLMEILATRDVDDGLGRLAAAPAVRAFRRHFSLV